MADRIGDILVRDGVITPADVDAGLLLARQQGIRLCSALVSLARLSADDASRALAEQHNVPAALGKHLEGRDLALASFIPAAVARELVALPLAMSRGQAALVVCVRDPVPATATALARAVGRPIVLAVAVECALTALLAETYPSDPDEFDVDLETDPNAEIPDAFDAMQLVDLDHRGVSKDHTQVGPTTPAMPRAEPGRRTPRPFDAVTEEASLELPSRPTERMTALPRTTGRQQAIELPAPKRRHGLDPALVAITKADSRDDVLAAILGFLRHRFTAGVVFVVKDGLALGQVGFGADDIDDAVAALVIPLNQRSVLRLAHDQGASYVGPPTETGVVQERFFKLLGSVPKVVLVSPIRIKGRVTMLIYAHGPTDITAEDVAGELGTLGAATEEAFVRIILETKSS